jgi:hypothetical protein
VWTYDVPLAVIERADGFKGIDDSLISEFNYWLDLPQDIVSMHVKQKLMDQRYDRDKHKLSHINSVISVGSNGNTRNE